MAAVRLGKGEHSGPSGTESKYQGILADLLKHRELGTPLDPFPLTDTVFLPTGRHGVL